MGDKMEATKRRKLWEHPNPKSTAMWAFMQEVNEREGLNLSTFDDLYRWTCENRSRFFGQLWESQGRIHEGTYERVVDESIPISSLPRWFEGLRLNFAENVLWNSGEGSKATRSTLNKEDDRVAITEIREGNTDIRSVKWGELRSRAAELAGALASRGVTKGDRVVAVGAHSVQTLLVMLATQWLGGIFSSSSTDMGVAGLLQRTVQIDPKLVFFDDAALYNGKKVDLRDKIAGVVQGMKQCGSFQGIVAIRRFGRPMDTTGIERTERLEDFLGKWKGQGQASAPPIVRVGFQDPAVVYYSSGTTGTPKAIVHAVGTLLINQGKESRLHHESSSDDVHLQYTTTGWIMYLSSVGHLLVGGRTILYDGSPLAPDVRVLLRIAEQQGVTMLGTSPRWMAELAKAGVVPRRDFDLSRLRLVTSTGMVLPDQMYEWFYDVAFDPKVHLSNICGGTDIAGCFVLANPLTPVYVGGSQGPSLGNCVAVFDHDLPEGSKGTPLPPGRPGDLVATAAFPNLPVCLWNDGEPGSAPGPKYRSAYFSRFSEAWAQGDFCQVDAATGNMRMLGRSDGVLNPSGVRFGSADIYAVVERHFAAQVRESICVGQRRPRDDDERVVLFLHMREGHSLDEALAARIRDAIAREFTKRHVPRFIFEMPEVPVTVNGKKVELPVKHIISGRTVKPSGTLLNPQSLEYFYRFQDVEKLASGPQAKL
ncbi:acetoacetyl-CoA synthetase [Geosmithia morbida]|uniref:Acetoacetyl-CoA synthetase n=1 Tax=Geosmithia morbida TaxID=1094350 RepID=A0A9P4YP46_9HYPO|nr:acetoacetyl-CoA synthetase [Geosmithia morbida]KAF4120546.1 acetoacetyl-CoA synthetase [Geosmithia morbida]